MDVLRGAFWYNIWVGIGFFFSFIVSLGISNFSGSQIYVSCAGTVNPVVSRIELLSHLYGLQAGAHFLRKCNNPL